MIDILKYIDEMQVMYGDKEPSSMDQEPRNMYNQGSSVDHAVRTIDPVQDSGNKIEEVLKAYGRYRGNRKGKPMSFSKFFQLYAPENFATGGSAGQLVSNTVDGSRPGYGGTPLSTEHIGNGVYEITYKGGSKTYYGKVQRNKKVLKSKQGTKENATKFVTEKRKLPQAKSVITLQSEKGTLLEQPKYKKALATALDDLAKIETKGYGAVDEIVKKYQNMFSRVGEKTRQGKVIKKGITTESRAITNAIRSYAAENNIRDVQIKGMEKALDNYIAKKTPERGYIPKLMKKYNVPEATFNSWLVELKARRKIKKKYGSEGERLKATRAKRSAALKKYSSPSFERWTKGTAASGLQGGHTGQIYSEEVTPKTKKFTPAIINQETLKKYDATLQAIADKRDNAFKAGNWDEVERLNQKGMNYAAATEGYKTFTVKNKDGTKFESGITTKGSIDPNDLLKEGITAKDMESYRMGKNPIVAKAKKDFKDKIISKVELENINASEAEKLFAEGKNKALLDFQKPQAMQNAKMSKKEITALDKRLAENFKDLTDKEQTRLASMGGKGCNGNFAPGGPVPNKIRCITKALDRLKNPENLGPGDKLNARKLFQSAGATKFGNFLRGFGIPGEILFETAFAIPNYLRGESGKRILGDTLLGLVGVYGSQSSEEEFLEYAKKKGLSDPTIELINDVNRVVDLGSSITKKEKTGRTTDPTELYNKVNPRGMGNVYKAEVDETNKIFDKYTMDQPQAKQQFNENMFSNAMQLGLDVEDDIQADRDKRIKERIGLGIIQDDITIGDPRGYAQGGLASLKRKI